MNSCKGTGFFDHSLGYSWGVAHANSGTAIRCANFHFVFWQRATQRMHARMNGIYYSIYTYMCVHVGVHMHKMCEV